LRESRYNLRKGDTTFEKGIHFLQITDGLQYKELRSTHAQGTDARVALGAEGELPGIYLGDWGGSRRHDPSGRLAFRKELSICYEMLSIYLRVSFREGCCYSSGNIWHSG